MTARVETTRHGRVLQLTLNAPGLRNAVGPEINAGLIAALEEAGADPGTGAVVLTGADGVFCAGGNLNRLRANREQPPEVQAESVALLNRAVTAVRACPRPVIAAVEGAAAGAGFSLALGSDLVVAAEDASFIMSHVKVGLNADGGGTAFLARALPPQLAAEILFEGGRMSAQRLHALGVVNRVVAPGRALAEALDWAARLAEGPPAALARAKVLLERAWSTPLADQMAAEAAAMVEAVHHAEAGEGIAAFLERRRPVFPRG